MATPTSEARQLLILCILVGQAHLLSALPFSWAWDHPQEPTHPAHLSTLDAINSLANNSIPYYWKLAWSDLTLAGQVSKQVQPPNTAQAPYSTGLKPAALDQLLDCLDSEPGRRASMTWDKVKSGHLSSLRTLAGFWTAEPSLAHVTIATFGTLDRLGQLHAQCRAWPGPTSVVLYEALLQPEGQLGLTPESKIQLNVVITKVVHMLEDLAQIPHACKMDVLVVYELFSEASAAVLAPLNMLRNYARIQARTPLIAMLDADLLPSQSLYNRVMQTDEDLVKEACGPAKQVFIIPAFDLHSNLKYRTIEWAQALASLDDKDMLLSALQHHVVHPFNPQWPLGHRMTNYRRWLRAQTDYTVYYETWAEPWVLSCRTQLPWADERFRGYGCDKNQFLHGVHVMGHKFRVLHDAFLLHRPHALAAARALYKGSTNGGAPLRPFLDALFDEQVAEGRSSKYNPKLNPSIASCKALLPWWQQQEDLSFTK